MGSKADREAMVSFPYYNAPDKVGGRWSWEEENNLGSENRRMRPSGDIGIYTLTLYETPI
jgi:hypothetical protein